MGAVRRARTKKYYEPLLKDTKLPNNLCKVEIYKKDFRKFMDSIDVMTGFMHSAEHNNWRRMHGQVLKRKSSV